MHAPPTPAIARAAASGNGGGGNGGGGGGGNPLKCGQCKAEFTSRNQLFKHLRSGSCVTLFDTVVVGGVEHSFLSLPTERVVLEVGYFGMTQERMEQQLFLAMDVARMQPHRLGRPCASNRIGQANDDDDAPKNEPRPLAPLRLPRYEIMRPQYACSAGITDAHERLAPENRLVELDPGCSVASCVVSVTTEKLPLPNGFAQTADEFVSAMNIALESSTYEGRMRVWNRMPVRGGGFNAFVDCHIRQFEYVAPCSALFHDVCENTDQPHRKTARRSRTAESARHAACDAPVQDLSELNAKYLPQLKAFKCALRAFRGRHRFHNFCDKDPVPHVPTVACRISRLYMTGAGCARRGDTVAGSGGKEGKSNSDPVEEVVAKLQNKAGQDREAVTIDHEDDDGGDDAEGHYSPDSDFLVDGVPCMRFVLRGDHWLSGQCRRLVSIATMVVRGLLPASVVPVLLSSRAVIVGIPMAPVEGFVAIHDFGFALLSNTLSQLLSLVMDCGCVNVAAMPMGMGGPDYT